MSCTVCVKNINSKISFNDCILECLEKIRIHYMSFKSQLEERDATIENLRCSNNDLARTINNLTEKLHIFKANSYKKRRKTNSFDSENETNASLSGAENPSRNALFSDKSLDDLNKALNINSDLDESIFGPSQTVICAKSNCAIVSVGKEEIVAQKNHTKSDQESEQEIITQSDVILPRRIKENNKKTTNVDKNAMKPPEWKCKSSTRLKNRKNVSNNNWNLSFIQPTQKKETFLQSPETKVVPLGNSPNKLNSPELSRSKSSLSLRRPMRHNLMRQTKINFKTEKENKDVDPDETYCDEVTPSPTCITLTASDNKKSRTRSLRKFDSKKFENITFDSSPKKSCEKTDPEGKMRIKFEPSSVKKETIRNIIKSLSPKKASPKKDDFFTDMSGVCEMEADASSSVVILPSQPDDVVFIEETDPGFDNIDSMDLLNEMMKGNETSDILKEIERERINEIKRRQMMKNNLIPLEKSKLTDQTEKTAALVEDNQPEAESDDELPVFDCDECRAYADFLGRALTKQEIAKRLRDCTKHKKPINLHQTPEGFWNPLFPTTQEINEMNQTIIDTRFTKKGKTT